MPLSSGLAGNNRSYDRMRNLSPSASNNNLRFHRSQRSAISPFIRKSSDPLLLTGVAGTSHPLSNLNKTTHSKEAKRVPTQAGKDGKEVCGQCVSKIIRSTVQQRERERMEEERPQLMPNLVVFQSREAGKAGQGYPELYFDRVRTSSQLERTRRAEEASRAQQELEALQRQIAAQHMMEEERGRSAG